jgi:hypothetical protein
MALPVYTTVEEADVILVGYVPWSTATDDQKLDALQMARVYTDQNYKINFDEDSNEGVPENVKMGNALIANENLIKDIFNRQDDLGALEEKTVKAASVTTTKKYKNNSVNVWKDPFAKATAIMNPDAALKIKNGMRNGRTIRN